MGLRLHRFFCGVIWERARQRGCSTNIILKADKILILLVYLYKYIIKMNVLNVELENCYGIKKLAYSFDFTQKSTYAIYAPNGVMKTSFAKTFLDLSNNQASTDSIFKTRVNKRNITDETGTEINNAQVFVITPYDKVYKSKKISTLLVNQDLKSRYEEIHLNINEKKDLLLKELKNLSGIKSNIEETFSNDFTHKPKEFFKAILRVKAEVFDKTEPELEGIAYQSIFNDKVIAFLETKDFKTKLSEYIDKYNELVDSSTYFKKGVFNHNNASTVAKQLKDNGFFKAKHSVSLNTVKSNKIITTEEELEQVIQQEKESILSNPDLVKAFEEIDKKITANQDLKNFREFVENNPIILQELTNLSALKQKLWISYLKRNMEAYKTLELDYENGAKEIEEIVEQAKKEETQWRVVIEEFNRRFFVPFKLSIDNQEDVILKSEGPNIKFVFEDFGEVASIQEDELFKVLSGGELRALYILNIIFEVEARRHSNQETLFIVDDIADSFDYKNKYAIIEYLKDISTESIFKQIILTHNFDFYRTVSCRLDMTREHKLNTIKTVDGIQLQTEKYQNNPFDTWKTHFHKLTARPMLIASIPFVRNLAEFAGHADSFIKLTSLLHVKEDTKDITIEDLEKIYREILKDKRTVTFAPHNKKVIDLIYETADSILQEVAQTMDLENKIVLAIAIRLKAEQYMIGKIADDVFWKGITKNQTFALFGKFLSAFPQLDSELQILKQVNLMTPENIHLNSFMYEPILDMSNEHLKQLYTDVKLL
jgi:energy-coupling factor transporter ATP-binding protein EcfA2